MPREYTPDWPKITTSLKASDFDNAHGWLGCKRAQPSDHGPIDSDTDKPEASASASMSLDEWDATNIISDCCIRGSDLF